MISVEFAVKSMGVVGVVRQRRVRRLEGWRGGTDEWRGAEMSLDATFD